MDSSDKENRSDEEFESPEEEEVDPRIQVDCPWYFFLKGCQCIKWDEKSDGFK